MAWISIHEEVDGPKLRKLKKRLQADKATALGILTFLWLWGLKNTDERGEVKEADRSDVEDALKPVTSLPIKDVVDALFEQNWLEENDGGIFIHDWDQWQEYWNKYQRTKARNAERKREERSRKTENRETPNALPEPPKLQPPPDTGTGDPPGGPPAGNPPETQYTPAFEAWWTEYPRKTDKGMAYKKYLARRKDGYSDAELMIAAKNYAAQCKKFKTEKQYIKHPKTFLSDALPFLEFIPKNPVTVAVTVQSDNPYAEWGEQNE